MRVHRDILQLGACPCSITWLRKGHNCSFARSYLHIGDTATLLKVCTNLLSCWELVLDTIHQNLADVHLAIAKISTISATTSAASAFAFSSALSRHGLRNSSRTEILVCV